MVTSAVRETILRFWQRTMRKVYRRNARTHRVHEHCIHCGLAIEKIRDPWGYDSHDGKPYGYFHPSLVDDGNVSKAEWCADGCTIAEPKPPTVN